MINWWLDRGVAGFRIDAIMNIKKPNIYTSYPADRDDGLASIDNMLHDAEGIDDFLHEMKTETFEKHQAFTVGEVFTDRPDCLLYTSSDRDPERPGTHRPMPDPKPRRPWNPNPLRLLRNPPPGNPRLPLRSPPEPTGNHRTEPALFT